MNVIVHTTDDARDFTRQDVEARAGKEFPSAELADIMAVLDRYGTQPHDKEIPRVQLALLKISSGRKDLLASSVELAKKDYRDVVAAAEYPTQMSLPPLKADGSNSPEIERARLADLEQYREWLGRA